MSENDDKRLKRLLRQEWPVQPPEAFTGQVMERVRQVSTAPAATPVIGRKGWWLIAVLMTAFFGAALWPGGGGWYESLPALESVGLLSGQLARWLDPRMLTLPAVVALASFLLFVSERWLVRKRAF
jgi:hypothetical protein